MLVANTLDNLSRQVEDQYATASTANDPCKTQQEVRAPNIVLSSARFKKKEVPTKNSKRKKHWFEVKCKAVRKVQSKTEGEVGETMKQEDGNDDVQAHVASNNAYWDSSKGVGEYRVISSFTELLTSSSPPTDLYDDELLL